MKKSIILSIVTYVLLTSNNSYCMLARVKPIIPRRAFIQQRLFHTSLPQKFDFLTAALVEDECAAIRSDIAEIYNQFAEQNKLLKQQIALAEKQHQLLQKNNALLKAIAQQNVMAHELIHTAEIARANNGCFTPEGWYNLCMQKQAIVDFNKSHVQPLLNE